MKTKGQRLNVMQCRASVSSRYSLIPHATAKRMMVYGGGGVGGSAHRCQQSVPPRMLGKAAGEGFNVDSGFETSDFDFTDFAEEMLPSRDFIQPFSLEQDGLVGDGRGIPFRTGAADRRCSGLSARRMSDCPRRMLNLLHGAKHRRKSRISFDFSNDLHQAEKSVQTSPIKHPNKNWRFEDARKAILVEMEAVGQLRKPHVLLLRFPDPHLSKEIVQGFSASIENVIFHRPATPRYCVVHLKPEADVDSVMKHISRIPFGAGKIMVERKTRNADQKPVVQPEDIDPYTLFIGNLPNVVTVQTVKQMFPAAKRIDIGHAQRIKHTRYAFIRFTNVEEAIQAFKANHNKVIDGKNIIIRFRRHNAPIALPEDTTTPKTPKRQKPGQQQQQLVVSVEQRPRRLSLVPSAGGTAPGHSGTLSTIKTEILDEEEPDGPPVGRNVKRYEGAGGPLCVIKSEPDDTDIEDSLEEEEDVDNIRDCKDANEQEEEEGLNLDEINPDENYCEDDDTDIDSFGKNYWTLEQLRRNGAAAGDNGSGSVKNEEQDLESATKTTSTMLIKRKDHKPPTTVIKTKRRDDQLNDLFSCLEPDDDLSL
uniref:RRM domain-containing protein n=1 Tax=Anopheles funestus TaxID=62324 RepID=A0A182REN3_ANOFN